MTERGRTSLERSGMRLAIGPSALSWTGDRLVIDLDEWTAPVPRRLRGRITVNTGPTFAETFSLDEKQRHLWRPIAPCATASVSFERPGLDWQGNAYLDMNAGTEPLEAGFKYWTWSRAGCGGATRILYDVEQRDGSRRSLALDYRSSGSMDCFDPPPVQPLSRTGWRVARATRAYPQAPARVLHTLEDTPFYNRSMLMSGEAGAEVRSIHESVDLDRFRSRWVQTLLPFKMPRRTR